MQLCTARKCSRWGWHRSHQQNIHQEHAWNWQPKKANNNEVNHIDDFTMIQLKTEIIYNPGLGYLRRLFMDEKHRKTQTWNRPGPCNMCFGHPVLSSWLRPFVGECRSRTASCQLLSTIWCWMLNLWSKNLSCEFKPWGSTLAMNPWILLHQHLHTHCRFLFTFSRSNCCTRDYIGCLVSPNCYPWRMIICALPDPSKFRPWNSWQVTVGTSQQSAPNATSQTWGRASYWEVDLLVTWASTHQKISKSLNSLWIVLTCAANSLETV